MTAFPFESQRLVDTATSLVAGDKGLLAMDESNPTCNKRFASLGIPQTEETRRARRELIVTTPALGESISGAILCDETIRQRKSDGTRFVEGMILKPNMVLPGLSCLVQAAPDDVADATVKCLLRAVPAAVPGVAFLSGGQPPTLATARLNAMNVRFKTRAPWAIAFSFARAIQEPALSTWRGNAANAPAAQRALRQRAMCNQAARRGEYEAALDSPGDALGGTVG